MNFIYVEYQNPPGTDKPRLGNLITMYWNGNFTKGLRVHGNTYKVFV